MARKDIPDGFAVVQLHDSRWYPLRVQRLYSVSYPDPDGWLHLETLMDASGDDISYVSRKEAEQECCLAAQQDAQLETWRWDYLTRKSDVYPDRCIHYREVIEEVTGKSPRIVHAYEEIEVTVVLDACAWCRRIQMPITVRAKVIEEALAKIAEQVYGSQCSCLRQHDLVMDRCMTA